MKLMVGEVQYFVDILNADNEKSIVFLHGFTGSTKTWQETAKALPGYRLVLVDLLGHGKTDSPNQAARYSMEQQLSDLENLFIQLELTRFALVGYSMGGRTALAYASSYPQRIQALILESASPGLQTEAERLERRQRDEQLAEKILAGGIISFVDKWQDIPLFDSQKNLPEDVRQAVREERLAQQPGGLANSLIGMGTGAQASLWGRLKQLELPVLLITGSLDPKFTVLAKKMLQALPNAEHAIIEAGHAIHVEKPVEFATMIEEYLSSNYQGGKS